MTETIYTIERGTISSASYDSNNEYGMLTCEVRVEYNNSGSQGYGNFSLDYYDKIQKKRIIRDETPIAMQKLISTFKATELNDLLKQPVLILKETGMHGQIIGISPADNINFHSFAEIFSLIDLKPVIASGCKNTNDQYVKTYLDAILSQDELENHINPIEQNTKKIKI